MRARDAIGPVSGLESLDLFQVIGLDRIGIHFQDLVGFIVLELEHALEGKHGLGLVEDVKHDDIVAGEPQSVQRPQHRIGVGQQVAEDHHQAAMPDHAGDLQQAGLDIGLAGGLELGQQREHLPSCDRLLPGARLWRTFWSNATRPTGSCWWIIR